MNGAETLHRTLLANGVDVCFMNPGTSEMQFVAALDRVPEMRGILCLFEGVCAGAADGYARMTGRPAATLLHLGPGLANGLANFHNARKARSPVVNVVGEHSTGHLRYEAPLTADVEAFARPVSNWVRTLKTAAGMGAVAAAAVRAARTPPGGVASLMIPADFSWSPGGDPGPALDPPAWRAPEAERIEQAARLLREAGARTGLLLSHRALLGAAPDHAGRIAAATGARVFANRYSARLTRGRGVFSPARLPYFPEPAEAALAGLEHLILVESEPPVSFFGYRNRRGALAPEGCAYHVLAGEGQDSHAALEALADACGARSATPPVASLPVPELPADGPLTVASLAQVIAALLPAGAVLSDEMVSSGEPTNTILAAAAPHDLLPVTGGAIGQGLPVAVGAAVACPHRKVVALEADGSAMYTFQSLWTMARENLDVTCVIFANRRYRILEVEMQRTGAAAIGPRAEAMLDIANPALDWVQLARGCGVDARLVSTTSGFLDAFGYALRRRGPFLIEARLPPR
jgi:acetolactate synthase-1/2/3 large subunit